MILLEVTIIVLLFALIFCVLKIYSLEKRIKSLTGCVTTFVGVVAGHKKAIDNLNVSFIKHISGKHD
jgi:hypothetical protein